MTRHQNVYESTNRLINLEKRHICIQKQYQNNWNFVSFSLPIKLLLTFILLFKRFS